MSSPYPSLCRVWENWGMPHIANQVQAALDAITAGAIADSVESATLDFKRQARTTDESLRGLAEAAACFANADGGVLVVGVRDRLAGPAAIEGTELDPMRVATRIYQLTEPHLTVDVRVSDYEGKRLIFVCVPRSSQIHQVDGRASHRVGTSCEPLTAGQIAALVRDRGGDDWSAQRSELSLADVSAAVLGMARDLLAEHPSPRHREYAALSDEDLLRALGLATPDGHLVQAGRLLLVRPEPGEPDLLVYQYRRVASGEIAYTGFSGRPMLPSLVRILETIESRVDTTPVNLPGGQQLQLADLPLAAVREAVINAVLHRDYQLGSPVRIEHAPERFAVSSPGPLVVGVTVDNLLTTPSRPRNPCLTKALRILGLAEEAGAGVDRMYLDMMRAGHNPPCYEDLTDLVRVVLSGGAPESSVARYVASLPASEAESADTLLVLHHLRQSRHVDAVQLSPVLQKSAEESEAVLRRLAGDVVGMIEPSRATARMAHPRYRLREPALRQLRTAVTYGSPAGDGQDEKVVALTQAAGMINTAMVRAALGIPAARATRLLSTLVGRGVLVRTTEAARGPGVRYGPGPAFPRQRRP